MNCVDDHGRTLLSLSLQSITSEGDLSYTRFLLVDKHADPLIADTNGLTPLHYWAMAPYLYHKKMDIFRPEAVTDARHDAVELHRKIGALLLERGSDATI